MTSTDTDHPTRTGALDWMFCDRTTGKRTIVQRPNLPLILFVVLRLAAIPFSGTPGKALGWAGSAVLAWWALDELLRGVNPFRRILGGVVLVADVLGVVASLR